MNDQDTLFYYATHDLEAEATSPKQQQKVPKSKKRVLSTEFTGF